MQGPVNIPLGNLPQELPHLQAIPGPIVLVCASGGRSAQAMAWLRAQGLDRVVNGGSWLDLM